MRNGGHQELLASHQTDPILAWDEPITFTEEHAHGDWSAQLVTPSEARAFYRLGLLRHLAGYAAFRLGWQA
jgi:hypothetical protein